MSKILIVDDREDNLLSIETLLQPSGYQFVKANSGRQALKILLSEFDFALILMDVQMPNLNGFETAELIYEREKLRHIPIIFITAHDNDDVNIFKGYLAGAVDYIYKPINPDLLRAKVSIFIELYRKNNQLLAQEKRLMAINKSLENEVNERKLSEEKVKALNLQLLQNISKLEIANRDLDRFAFMASHDLQEPLRKIRTFSDRLSTKYGDRLDENGHHMINRIQTATERLQSLIKDIMIFSKISIERGPFIKSDLNAMIDDILLEMETTISEKRATVKAEKLGSIYINPVLFRHLFYNLIGNALKYCRKDTDPLIRIYSESGNGTTGSENSYFRIYFEDNGIGFEQQYAEQIFDMFKRLHHQDEYEGTGIGLALCKKIMEEHNGHISAKGIPGQGATFILSIPFKELGKKQISLNDVPVS